MFRTIGLFLLLSACANTPPEFFPEIGREATFDVATWNVERFGNDRAGPDDTLQMANVKRVIAGGGIELWGLQEIEDLSDLERLGKLLGSEWEIESRSSSTNLHLAFVYRTNSVRPLQVRQILTEHAHAFAGRPPLEMRAEVTTSSGTRTLTFINLHMKAFGDPASWERRVVAADLLRHYLNHPERREEPFVVMGDFNDGLASSIRTGYPSSLSAFVDDSAYYRFTTSTLEDRRLGTYCFTSTCESATVVDHILISDELFSFDPDGAVRYDLLLSVVDDYTLTTSDHLPVVLRLNFSGQP